MSDFLICAQDDLEGLLLCDSRLAEVPVLVERKGVTDEDVAQAIGVFNSREGSSKVGLAIIVTMPRIDRDGESAMLLLDNTITIKVFELPIVNMSESGHGVSAESTALMVLGLVHNWSIAQSRTLNAAQNAIEPTDAPEGHIGYDVNFVWKDGLAALQKTPRPAINYDEESGEVTITCSDQSAVIWYTEDGSFPVSNQGTSIEYNQPVTYLGQIVSHEDGVVRHGVAFQAETGTEIRAIAIQPEKLPSNLKAITLSEPE
ncbi:MAG: FN3 associated domain-containing protein [Verrucomicrobiota bacterium]